LSQVLGAVELSWISMTLLRSALADNNFEETVRGM
jgi:hypothetical protein